MAYREPFPPGYEVPLFNIFSNADYQCLQRHLFKFMISCREVMNNNNLLLWLFSLSLNCTPLDWYMDLASRSIPSQSYFIEIFIHEFMRPGMEPQTYEWFNSSLNQIIAQVLDLRCFGKSRQPIRNEVYFTKFPNEYQFQPFTLYIWVGDPHYHTKRFLQETGLPRMYITYLCDSSPFPWTHMILIGT